MTRTELRVALTAEAFAWRWIMQRTTDVGLRVEAAKHAASCQRHAQQPQTRPTTQTDERGRRAVNPFRNRQTTGGRGVKR